MDILIPQAILAGLAAGILLHKVTGYFTIPIVSLGMGVFWAGEHAGDVAGGTADIFNNQAPELLGGTLVTFMLAGAQAGLACWVTIALLNYVYASAANRRARKALTGLDPQKPRRPT